MSVGEPSGPKDGSGVETGSRVVVRRAVVEDLPGIDAALRAALAADPIPGFTTSDIERALTRIEPEPTSTAVALVDGRVIGACTPRLDDLTVAPDHRRRGAGRALFQEATAIAREQGLPYLQLYVPEHLPGSQAFARAMGMTYHSSLWLFRLASDVPVPAARFPAGVAPRAYVDDDLEPFVALANASFADHPTPVSWSVGLIRHVHGLPDFDPSGILVVRPADDPERLVAFARVETARGDDGARVGWIRLIGVLPDWRGRGLGRELLRWSVGRLRAHGVDRIELAVEATNDRALELYRRHGFEPAIEWPHWVLRV
jgi:mycothiol synthase